MASADPVIINSSSPLETHFISSSPPSSTAVTPRLSRSSSSSRLPSPYAFIGGNKLSTEGSKIRIPPQSISTRAPYKPSYFSADIPQDDGDDHGILDGKNTNENASSRRIRTTETGGKSTRQKRTKIKPVTGHEPELSNSNLPTGRRNDAPNTSNEEELLGELRRFAERSERFVQEKALPLSTGRSSKTLTSYVKPGNNAHLPESAKLMQRNSLKPCDSIATHQLCDTNEAEIQRALLQDAPVSVSRGDGEILPIGIVGNKQGCAPSVHNSTKLKRGRTLKKSVSIIIDSDEPEAAGVNVMEETDQHRRSSGAVATDYFPARSATSASPMHDENDNGEYELESPAPRHQVTADTVLQTRSHIACRRRRSWTPIRDTTNFALSNDCNKEKEEKAAESVSRLEMSKLLAGLGYASPEQSSDERLGRAATGEALTKRRRVERVKVSTNTRKHREKLDTKCVKPKRTKSTKKAQTITALATAAYQRPAAVQRLDDDQGTLNEQTADNPSLLTKGEETGTNSRKKLLTSKNPPKAKLADNSTTTVQNGAKVAKRKRSKIDEQSNNQTLDPPNVATRRLDKQIFIFGSSSQLAGDKSPVSIPDTQATKKGLDGSWRNQDVQSSQGDISPARAQSRIDVPTAPHGTSLSVDQNERNLWRVAARGQDGGLFRQRNMVVFDNYDPRLIKDTHISMNIDPNPPKDVPCAISNGHGQLTGAVDESMPLGPKKFFANTLGAENPNYWAAPTTPGGDGGWILLQSGSSTPLCNGAQGTRVTPAPWSSPSRKFLSPRRPPLQALDTNGSIKTHDNLLRRQAGQKRTIATTKKGSSETKPVTTQTRRRGRKEATPRTGSIFGSASATTTIRSSPAPKQADARGSKNDTNKPLSPFKIAKNGVVSPKSSMSHSCSDDDISDCDSPRISLPPILSSCGRRSTPSHITVQPSILSAGAVNNGLSQAANSVTTSITAVRVNDLDSTATAATLDPHITAIVKAQTQNKQATERPKLLWWDKILLYDPIELEEFTAWLNAQGLRIKFEPPEPKQAKKARKKTKSCSTVEDFSHKLETQQMELKPSVVQKWCESKSICCFLKESGWHGPRKSRY